MIYASRPFYKKFHTLEPQTEGKSFYELGNRQWDIPDLRRLLEDILPERKEMIDFEVEHDFPEIGHRKMLLNAREIRSEGEGQALILLSIADVTGEKKRK